MTHTSGDCQPDVSLSASPSKVKTFQPRQGDTGWWICMNAGEMIEFAIIYEKRKNTGWGEEEGRRRLSGMAHEQLQTARQSERTQPRQDARGAQAPLHPPFRDQNPSLLYIWSRFPSHSDSSMEIWTSDHFGFLIQMNWSHHSEYMMSKCSWHLEQHDLHQLLSKASPGQMRSHVEGAGPEGRRWLGLRTALLLCLPSSGASSACEEYVGWAVNSCCCCSRSTLGPASSVWACCC